MTIVNPVEPARHPVGKTADIITHLLTRRSVSPKKLDYPAPSEAEIDILVRLATTAPAHDAEPAFRILAFPGDQRPALANLFEKALLEGQPAATAKDRDRAREKAFRGPCLLGLIARRDPDPIRHDEHQASAGAALQAILTGVHLMGYAARATSGQSVRTKIFRRGLGLSEREHVLCFISIGTALNTPTPHMRRPTDTVLSVWQGGF